MKFRLRSDAYLVEGKNGSAIYDGGNSRVYLLKEWRDKALRLLENNFSVQDAAFRVGVGEEQLREWLCELRETQLGDFLDWTSFVEKVNHFPRWRDEHVFQSPPAIQSGFITVSGPCDIGCSYCTSSQLDLKLSCWRCMQGPEVTASALAKLLHVIEVYQNLGVHDLYFSTPPTVDIEHILSPLVSKAAECGYTPTVTSDLTLVNGDNFTSIVDQIQLMLKVDADRWSPLELKAKLRDLPSQLRIILVLGSKENSEQLSRLLDAQGIQWIGTEVVEPLSLRRLERLGPTMPDTRTFNMRQRMHVCLSTTLAVSSTGTVSTCPMMHTRAVAGNFDLVKALRSEDYLIQRRLTMGRMNPCRDCQLRYACLDCRYIELRAGADMNECVTCTRLETTE